MNQTQQNLNLARKWRPKTFDNIVGQEISVRMLKNSLYLNKLFPVYLFAGQRGCGKTSTARVFGAAVNCKNLEQFRQKPTKCSIPCLECESCKSMLQTNHPDFIEIDAASHTGVENVRQILESCTYMPLVGTKKIYLIDEAHMLSKAAFNAFLKILEEPPASALFILATTEIHKFPETVLSRCFQVVFKSIQNTDLKEHLKNICQNEEIKIEERVLDILIQETEGSARDAINLLERVRFSEQEVTVDSLLHVLGKISESELFNLFNTILEQDAQKLLATLCSENLQHVNPQTLWTMLVQLCRTLLWVKFDTPQLPIYFNDIQGLNNLAQKCSLNRLNAIMQLMWSQEELFLRTPNKQVFLETVLLQIAQQVNIANIQDLLKHSKTNHSISEQKATNRFTSFTPSPHPTQIAKPQSITIPEQKPQEPQNQPKKQKENIAPPTTQAQSSWQGFLAKITEIQDPFLLSIFTQAKFIKQDSEKKVVVISLSNNSTFFTDKIKDSENLWMAAFKQAFDGYTGFNFQVSKNPPPSPTKPSSIHTTTPDRQINRPTTPPPPPRGGYAPTVRKQGFSSRGKNFENVEYVNISNIEQWPKANLITKYFPGKIRKGKITN
jgi:DNA polymerase III subunit gamma/tau